MVCGRQATRTEIRRGQAQGAGPSQPPQPRRSSRASDRQEPPGIQRARDFTHDMFQDSVGAGVGYNAQDLIKLFKAVTGNPRITVAKVQNLFRTGISASAEAPIRAFANGLPASNLIAANLGEYTAPYSAWNHLLQKIQSPNCILGHLYISEPSKGSGLTPALKQQMIGALRHNRSKAGYKAKVDTQAKRERVISANCWYNPKRIPTR